MSEADDHHRDPLLDDWAVDDLAVDDPAVDDRPVDDPAVDDLAVDDPAVGRGRTEPDRPMGRSRRELLRDAGVLGLAAGLPGLSGVGGLGAEASAQVPPAFGTVAGPNVVVVVIDSLRTDHVGAYGGRRARTPTLDALAKESLVFDQARHEAMPTVPMRRSLMTGRRLYPFRGWKPSGGGLPAQPGWQGIGRSERTFTDVLGARGYLTGYVTDNPHLRKPAFASFRRRFDAAWTVTGQIPGHRVKRKPVSARELRRHLAPELRGVGSGRIREYLAYNAGRDAEQDHLAALVFRRGMDFIDRASRQSRPFALVVDCFDVHEPWDPPDRYLSEYARIRRGGYRPIQPFPTPFGWTRDISKRTLKLARAMYAAETTFLDAWLGRFLRRLDELGLGNTWVVVVSDHGVYLGEHGMIGKTSREIHSELLRVPLMIRHPLRVGAGRRTDYFASAHDIGPTVLAGLGVARPKSMNGTNLGPLLTGKRARGRSIWTSVWNDKLLAGDGRWLLVADNDRGRIRGARLHDTRADPAERRDVARRNPAVVRRLTAQLRRDAGKGGLPSFR